MRPEPRFSKLVTALQYASLAVWLGCIGLFFQYAGTRPSCPDPAAGRIYSVNNHGQIAYLTRAEDLRLYAIGGFAALLMGLAFAVHRWKR